MFGDKVVNSTDCNIVPVGKRRDGGTRYWCLEHRADATAKYGRPSASCRHAAISPITPSQRIRIDIRAYPGGLALWGAVPPVFDTTAKSLDRGVHVHARRNESTAKCIDGTFREVELVGIDTSSSSSLFRVSELDAIYYMVSSVFGYSVKYIECTYCGYPHLDKDWFSVHPHRRHLCAGCGKHFRDVEIAIGNPLAKIREQLKIPIQTVTESTEQLHMQQSDLPGGIRIWGSNPAIAWTASNAEAAGIHIHGYAVDKRDPVVDDTYRQVRIDEIDINADMVRILMAQMALPHLAGRIIDISCSNCGTPHFDTATWAYTPHTTHTCESCGANFGSGRRLRKCIGNPLIGLIAQLGKTAPRPPKSHEIGLLTEAP